MEKGELIKAFELQPGVKLCGVLNFKFQIVEVGQVVESGAGRMVEFKPAAVGAPYWSYVGASQVYRLAA